MASSGRDLLPPQKMENKYLFHIFSVEIKRLFHFIALVKSFRFSINMFWENSQTSFLANPK